MDMSMGMTVGICIMLANAWGIIRTVRSDANANQKMLWVGIILLLPFVGVVAWILFGPS